MVNRIAGAAGTNLFLAVYENDAADGQTWTPGTLVGVSTNQQNMNVNGSSATWTFNNLLLSDNSRYMFTFTSDAAGTTTVVANTRVTLNAGNTEQSAFNSGNASFSGSHAMSAEIITTVPEPSSTALLGLGGLALILRRRK